MAAENESPARDSSTRGGRGRGGRGGRSGRGRGGGRGNSSSAASVRLATMKSARGGTRRGRAKSFTDSRVQAAYERQRDLKATYQAVAHAIKPALQELAERSVDEILQKPETFRLAKEHQPVLDELQLTLDKKIAQHDQRLNEDLKLATGTWNAENYVTEREFQNAVDDLEEQFYEGQENRVRIIASLLAKGLPVDLRDDQFQYKVISDKHLDRDFGLYECYKNGHLVPYPSRVRGTEMWKRVRDADAALVAASSAAKARSRGAARTLNKRRAQDQPDGQPTPKKSTRGNVDEAAFIEPDHIAPAPAKGLLASAAEAEAHPDGVEEESVPASPEPSGPASTSQDRDQSQLSAREKSPPLPKNLGEPDEFGFRLYTQRPSLRDKGINGRLFAPNVFQFNDWEIGFRDTSNDSTKGHTHAKRGKYLDTPNSNGMHFDHWCNGYDFGATEPEDFDQDLVEKHNLHPTYGIFMPSSKNDFEEPEPCDMPGKPVVFIANPSGRVSFASRSLIPTINHRRAEEAPLRLKFSSSLRRFCKMAEIDTDDVSVAEYMPTDQELKKKSLRIANKELKARPRVKEVQSEDEKDEAIVTESKDVADDLISAMSVLTYASAFVEAENSSRTPAAPPKPARYDAIRDVFTDAKPAVASTQENKSLELNFLAELCNVEARLPGAAGAVAPVENHGSAVKKEEPYSSSFNGVASSGRGDQPPPFANRDPRDRAFRQPPAVTTSHEPAPYPSSIQPYDRPLPQLSPDYKSAPGDHHSYSSYSHGGYPAPDHRDTRPLDPSPYRSRRLSGYSESTAPPPPASSSSYPRMYWPQQPPSAPPPPPSTSQHYPAPPPPPLSHSRMSFSQGPSSSNEPLPPLRPSRNRHSLPEESVHDPMRSNSHGSIYYPPGPTRSYHRGYPAPPEPMPSMHNVHGDRMLPSPQQTTGQGYMGSPPSQGYAPQAMSPTFAAQAPPPIGHSPPGTPQGSSSSINRHRSTPSGSSDAGNKYRKLQPAPVPAHRSWNNKPELKTIPYDHKETGSSAALPSSGPTQIRGWNVNQPRKRSKMERERAESANDESR